MSSDNGDSIQTNPDIMIARFTPLDEEALEETLQNKVYLKEPPNIQKAAHQNSSTLYQKNVQNNFFQFHQYLKTKYTSRIKYIAYLTPVDDQISYRPLSQQNNKFNEKIESRKSSSKSVYKKRGNLSLQIRLNIQSPKHITPENSIDDDSILKYSKKWQKKKPKKMKQLIPKLNNQTAIIFLEQFKLPSEENKKKICQKKSESMPKSCSNHEQAQICGNKNKLMLFPENQYDGIKSIDIPSKLKYKLLNLKKILKLQKIIPEKVDHLKRKAEDLYSQIDEKSLKVSLLNFEGENQIDKLKKNDDHTQKIINYKFNIQRSEGRGNNDYFRRLRQFEETAKINISKKQLQMKSFKQKIKKLKKFQDLRTIDRQLESYLKEIEATQFKRKLQK